MDDMLRLAERIEDTATQIVAEVDADTEILTDDHRIRAIAYASDCFTVAAALRARHSMMKGSR